MDASERKLHIAGLLEKAVNQHRKGNLKAAKRCYGEILSIDPMQPETLHLFGRVQLESGNPKHAVQLIKQAIRIKPGQHYFYTDLGRAYEKLDDRTAAEACYQKSIDIKPDYHEGLFRLAELYSTHCALGKSIPLYKRAIAVKPEFENAYTGLGMALYHQGKIPESCACLENAVKIQPNAHPVWNNMTIVLRAAGRYDEAAACGKKAVAIKPDHWALHHNTAAALSECGKFDEALDHYKKSIALYPGSIDTHLGMGIVHQEKGEQEQAAACFETALDLNPDHSQALALLINQLMQFCDWKKLEKLTPRLDRLTEMELKQGKKTGEMPFLNLSRHNTPLLNQKVAESWSRDIETVISPMKKMFGKKRGKKTGAKINIGYLSNNIRNHPTSHLISDIFRFHDRSGFNVSCYSFGPDDKSIYRKTIERTCDAFIDLSKTGVVDAAKRISDDRIHILVDLVGYMKGHRTEICALRPAPLQVRWLGMAGTSGASFYDYLIADAIVIPQNQYGFFNEKILNMPCCYQVNSAKQKAKKHFSREDFGLPEKKIVFCSFNTGYKIDPVIFGCWAQILDAVPESVLWLMAGSCTARKNLHQAAEKLGLASDRIVFADKVPIKDHLARINLSDIALDTSAVNGAATTSDALWQGVPVLTLQGSHFASRMSSSILKALDLEMLITHSFDQYRTRAVDLALNPDLLKRVKHKLMAARKRSNLFNTEKFVKDLESLYTEMIAKPHPNKNIRS